MRFRLSFLNAKAMEESLANTMSSAKNRKLKTN